jgi:hypothetical protein
VKVEDIRIHIESVGKWGVGGKRVIESNGRG